MRRSWLTAAAIAVLVAGVVVAQEPAAPSPQPQPTPTFRTGVNLVRVDVTVTGKGDAPVTDLRAEDFSVEEDGVPQRIESFQFVALSGQPAPGDDTSLAIRSPEHAEVEAAREDVRLFVIFLDDYHLPQYALNNIELRKALTRFIEREIEPTDLVAIMDPLTPMTHIGWTRDKAALVARIRNYEGMEGNYTKARSALEEGQLQSRDVLRVRAEVTLSALHGVVAYLATLREGRKSVIFVSKGPPLVFRDGTATDIVQDVVRSANQGNVVINVMDPQGLTIGMSARDSLYVFAGETGGRTIVNTNDLTGGLKEIATDASAYYLLGYQPAHPIDDGKVHKIDVHVKRRGVRLLSRRAYAAPPPAPEATPTLPEAAPDVRAAMTTLSESKAGRLATLSAGQRAGAPGATTVRFSWAPGPKASDQRPTRLDVKVLRGDQSAAGEVSLAWPATTAPELQLAPGRYSVQATVYTADGTPADRWTEPLEVANFASGALAITSPELFVARSVAELKQVLAGGAAPSTEREFRHTDRVVVRFDTAAGADAAVAAELLNQAGAVLVVLPLRTTNATSYDLELPLANLARGNYVLRIQATSDAGHDAKLVAFRMVP